MIDSNVFVYAVYLGIYIAIMIGIGIYYGKKSKSMDEYLVAGRSQGFWSITGTMVATSCGAAAFIGFDFAGNKTIKYRVKFFIPSGIFCNSFQHFR